MEKRQKKNMNGYPSTVYPLFGVIVKLVLLLYPTSFGFPQRQKKNMNGY